MRDFDSKAVIQLKFDFPSEVWPLRADVLHRILFPMDSFTF
jgi:hypothetical protein